MPTSTKSEIAKLTTDIERIEKSFFAPGGSGFNQVYFALVRKREHLLRSNILELHLTIEDLITGAIGNALLRNRLIRSPVLRELATRARL